MKTISKYKPIIFVEIFLVFVLLFYFFGPIQWKTPNPLLLVSYLVACFSFLFFGYSVYCNLHRNCWHTQKDSFSVPKERLLKILKVMLFFNLIVFTLYLIRNLGDNVFSFENLINWIANPSGQYISKFNRDYGLMGKLIASLATISSFFLWPTIPLGIYLFKEISLKYKILLFLNVFIELTRWFAMGTNKGIVDFILIVLSFLFLYFLDEKRKTRYKLLFLVLGIMLVVFGLNYFNSNVSGRINNNYQYLMNNLGGNELDMDNWLLQLFPNFKGLIINADSYFTQGYYGLSLSFNESYTPMFGLLNSGFVRENIEELFGVDLYQYTYMHKISVYGWNEYSVWHSAFLWLACDFGFLGTLFVMFIVGYYFAFVCCHIIVKKNPLFFPLFAIMIQFFFYISMNNQIFNMPFSFMGFWGMNIYLMMNKKKASALPRNSWRPL